MTPTVVFDTFGIVSRLTNGVVLLAYLVALLVMVLTAISYGKMVREFQLLVWHIHTNGKQWDLT
ncbi:hypothetical protein [Psychrobacillus sp. L3]|uniref:hypothetical protein n=1 Tax=Psychrobacillus sp. L3 TaxID=3236891 RepID=UPI0036F1B320